MSAVILTAVLSCLNSASMWPRACSLCWRARRCAALAGRTNRRHVPARAVLLASAFGFAGVIAAILSPDVVFKFLVNASGAVIAVIYIAIGVSQVRSRESASAPGAPPPALPMWLFPWLSYLAIAAMRRFYRDGFHPVAPRRILGEHGLGRGALLVFVVFRRGARRGDRGRDGPRAASGTALTATAGRAPCLRARGSSSSAGASPGARSRTTWRSSAGRTWCSSSVRSSPPARPGTPRGF